MPERVLRSRKAKEPEIFVPANEFTEDEDAEESSRDVSLSSHCSSTEKNETQPIGFRRELYTAFRNVRRVSSATDSIFYSSPNESTTQNKVGGFPTFLWHHFCGILVAVAFILLILSFSTNVKITKDSTELRAEFGVELGRVLKLNYPSLPKLARATLGAIADRWLLSAGEETAPVVVVLAGKSSEQLLADLVNSSSHLIGLRDVDIFECEGGTSRAQLHSALLSAVRDVIPTRTASSNFEAKLTTVAVRSIQLLRWDAPLALHAFADADHSFGARPLIWLQIGMEDDPEDCESSIQRHLSKQWKSSGGSDDNVPPILARIMHFTICF